LLHCACEWAKGKIAEIDDGTEIESDELKRELQELVELLREAQENEKALR
jgi:hypothetical protein